MHLCFFPDLWQHTTCYHWNRENWPASSKVLLCYQSNPRLYVSPCVPRHSLHHVLPRTRFFIRRKPTRSSNQLVCLLLPQRLHRTPLRAPQDIPGRSPNKTKLCLLHFLWPNKYYVSVSPALLLSPPHFHGLLELFESEAFSTAFWSFTILFRPSSFVSAVFLMDTQGFLQTSNFPLVNRCPGTPRGDSTYIGVCRAPSSCTRTS